MTEFVGFNKLYDIPVYRCSPEKFGREWYKLRNFYLEPMDKENAPDTYKKVEAYFSENHDYKWRYNEIVGYIHLYTERSHISSIKIVGDLFLVRSKRIRKGNKEKIFYSNKVYEHWVHSKDTSEKIHEDLLSGLENLCRKSPFNNPLQNRHLGLEDFRNFGTYLDWRKYIERP